MHVYSHHIGDFNTATLHLSRLERSIYRDALEYYYVTESPLDGSDFDLLARRLRCETDAEKDALRFVLTEFFDIDESACCYIQPRCERELADYRVAVAASGAVKANVNKRQQVHREQRKAMFAALRAKGVVLPWDARTPDVRAAFEEHCKGVDLSRTSHAPVTANHIPLPIPQNQVIPPNPPAGGAEAGDAAQSAEQPGDGQQAVRMQNPAATVAQLLAFFPEKRRTRAVEVARLVVELVEGGSVTEGVLLAAAAAQSTLLCADDGKACPSVLRWLRESRWKDPVAGVTGGVTGGVSGAVTGGVSGVTGVAGNWMQSRSGVEAMGIQLGLGAWDENKDRLFAAYDARVMAAYRQKFGVGMTCQ